MMSKAHHDWNQGRKSDDYDSTDLSGRDFPDPDDRPTGGIKLETTPITAPAHTVFTPEELEARITAIRERVEREEPASQRDEPRRNRNGQ